ncbi:3-ketoacyl-CoA synthase 21 [Morus notabilis]|uniref:3-ketoacyl-CoA synthase 21 n=1 Tax=Morus notabilis TaxID=981085 RepID=W9RCZ2_9ROSA|nr:3-ketoacyl-CoA synthase 21 [Morus notabilis]
MELLLATCLVPLIYSFICLYNLALQWRNSSCYMLAFECYKATEDRKLGTDTCVKIILRNKNLDLEGYRHMLKTITSSGLGEETYCPRNFTEGQEECATLSDALLEMDDIFFFTLDRLFKRTGVSPSQIDILVVNVSLFSPMPSLTSRIVNQYKLRNDIKAFNLSGMGFSGSLAAIDLVQRLFKTYKNKYAIVVSTESLGPNWYCGKDKTMMLANCLYRSGGCSLLFKNRRALKHRAILRVRSIGRTHLGSSDRPIGALFKRRMRMDTVVFNSQRTYQELPPKLLQ